MIPRNRAEMRKWLGGSPVDPVPDTNTVPVSTDTDVQLLHHVIYASHRMEEEVGTKPTRADLNLRVQCTYHLEMTSCSSSKDRGGAEQNLTYFVFTPGMFVHTTR